MKMQFYYKILSSGNNIWTQVLILTFFYVLTTSRAQEVHFFKQKVGFECPHHL